MTEYYKNEKEDENVNVKNVKKKQKNKWFSLLFYEKKVLNMI